MTYVDLDRNIPVHICRYGGVAVNSNYIGLCKSGVKISWTSHSLFLGEPGNEAW